MRGTAFGRAYAALVDDWLTDLLGATEGVAVVGVGGYGRAELAPGSDLDVLLVHARPRDVATIADALWYPIWNAGFRLDHSVRTVKEAVSIADHDLKAALGLLDARCIAGDRALADELSRRAADLWRSRARRWVPALVATTRERQEEVGAVAFALEPELKEGHGGLRDVTALRALTAAVPVVELTPSLSEAAAELFDVRVGLQRVSGRPDDRLLLEYQDDVATILDRGDADQLMRDVAAAARTVAWSVDEASRAVTATLEGPRGRSRPGADLLLDEGIARRDGEIAMVADADPAADPALLLRVADLAATEGRPIARPTLRRLAAEAAPLADPWPPGARDALIGLLGAGIESIRVFETLDQYGLVTRVLPEWAEVRSRPQRNAFHRFTVDRHLVEAATRAALLTREVTRPDLLLVGAFLHDLGKGFPGDHTDAGVDLVGSIARRMGFVSADVDLLVAMVRFHLLLPSVATSRDLDDPATIRSVADAIRSVVLLELLHALTEADSLATGDTAWSPWKAELVTILVERVGDQLAGRTRVNDDADASEADVRLVARATGDLLVEGRENHVVVVAPDEAGLFSRVVGVLGLHGHDVRAARARSTDEGVAISEFDVDPSFGELPNWARFEADVRLARRGRLAIDARLRERAQRYERLRRPSAARSPEARVIVDNGSASAATIVEVRAPDGIGVLYRITRALADFHLDIRHAKVQTMGHEVVDTFYVVTGEHAKADEPGLAAELEAAILSALRPGG